MPVATTGATAVAWESPRLAALARSGASSFEASWARLKRAGVPLVEKLRGDPGHRLVTFVWRPEQPVREPSVYNMAASMHRSRDWRQGMALQPLGRGNVWYLTMRLPRGAIVSYGYSPDPLPGPSTPGRTWDTYLASLVVDPENRLRRTTPADPDVPGDRPITLSVLELPGARQEPWLDTPMPPGWTEDHHRIASRQVGGERSVWVLTPPDYRPGRGRPNVVIVFDGYNYRTVVPTPRILAHLVQRKAIGPTVGVFVSSGPEGRVRDLGANPRWVDFLVRELLPWLRRRYGIRAAPERTVLAGSSLGGMAAAHAALVRPDRFRNVLAQSGAFLWSGPKGERPLGWLMNEFARRPRAPVSFYLDIGAFDLQSLGPGDPSMQYGVRHLRDVLTARGYPLTYAEFPGGHDYACWRLTFGDGLVALLGRTASGASSGVQRRRSRPRVGSGKKPSG